MRRGDARGGLHGGSHLRHSWSDHWYRYQDGLMRNGLTVITFFLTDAAEGDGGFACVPGSHKSNYLDLLPPDVRNYERPAPYVLQPAVEAGAALIFTAGAGARHHAVDRRPRAALPAVQVLARPLGVGPRRLRPCRLPLLPPYTSAAAAPCSPPTSASTSRSWTAADPR